MAQLLDALEHGVVRAASRTPEGTWRSHAWVKRGILAAFRKMAHVPFVVALNRAAGLDPSEEDNVRHVLELGEDVPVVPCDATDRESVKAVLLALLYSVVDQIDAPATAHA